MAFKARLNFTGKEHSLLYCSYFTFRDPITRNRRNSDRDLNGSDVQGDSPLTGNISRQTNVRFSPRLKYRTSMLKIRSGNVTPASGWSGI